VGVADATVPGIHAVKVQDGMLEVTLEVEIGSSPVALALLRFFSNFYERLHCLGCWWRSAFDQSVDIHVIAVVLAREPVSMEVNVLVDLCVGASSLVRGL